MSKLEQAAIEAIFQRQLPTPRAVEFVVNAAGCDARQADRALREAMTPYKKR